MLTHSEGNGKKTTGADARPAFLHRHTHTGSQSRSISGPPAGLSLSASTITRADVPRAPPTRETDDAKAHPPHPQRGRSRGGKPPSIGSLHRHRKRSHSPSSDTGFGGRPRNFRAKSAKKHQAVRNSANSHQNHTFDSPAFSRIRAITPRVVFGRRRRLPFCTSRPTFEERVDTGKPTRELRMAIELFGLFRNPKMRRKPNTQNTIPEALKQCSHSITNIRRPPRHGHDACNYFILELPDGSCETNPITLLRYRNSVGNSACLPNHPTHTRPGGGGRGKES